MSYRIEPQSQRIEAAGMPPRDFDTLRYALHRSWSTPIRVSVVGRDVPALDHHHNVVPSELVLVHGPQGAFPGPEAFRIGGEAFTGTSLLACRLDGDKRWFDCPSRATGLIECKLSLDEVRKLVQFKPSFEEAEVGLKRYSEPMLRGYCQRLVAMAEEVRNDDAPPFKLRVYAVDVNGVECGAVNIDVFDWKSLRRWASEAFDRHQNSMHEWALREGCAYGSAELTRPLFSLADVREVPTPGALVVHGADRDYHISAAISPWPRGSGLEPVRVPFPGVTWFRPYAEEADKLVTVEEAPRG